MHTHMNRPNTWCLDCILSYWAHFAVLRFILRTICILCLLYVALLQHGEEHLVGLKDHYFLQCFDTVGWVILHIKTRL